jgi:hypothetical protein
VEEVVMNQHGESSYPIACPIPPIPSLLFQIIFFTKFHYISHQYQPPSLKIPRASYVGTALLSAVACGDIFASPSMKQVLSAIASVPSSLGTILLITNYTGDKLHFGLAAERALTAGLAKKCVVLPATDDVSIPRSKAEKVGRRGLAGNVLSEFVFLFWDKGVGLV